MVDLPTPPLPETNVTTGTPCRRSLAVARPAAIAPAIPIVLRSTASRERAAASSSSVMTRSMPALLARERSEPDACGTASTTCEAPPSAATAAATFTAAGPRAPSATRAVAPLKSPRSRSLKPAASPTHAMMASASQARTYALRTAASRLPEQIAQFAITPHPPSREGRRSGQRESRHPPQTPRRRQEAPGAGCHRRRRRESS